MVRRSTTETGRRVYSAGASAQEIDAAISRTTSVFAGMYVALSD